MLHQWDAMIARGRLAQLLARSPVRRRLVALLLRGYARKEIASAMQRSPHTIDAHLKAIYRHVGIGDRGRLMLLASSMGPSMPPPRNKGLSGRPLCPQVRGVEERRRPVSVSSFSPFRPAA